MEKLFVDIRNNILVITGNQESTRRHEIFRINFYIHINWQPLEIYISLRNDTTNPSTWLIMKLIKFSPEMERKMLSQNTMINVQYDDFFTVVNNNDFNYIKQDGTKSNIKVGSIHI